MGDWNLLGSILEEVHIHSTIVGKVWLTILFIFRMLVLGVAAEDVWDDEQTEFVCNTDQPGCKTVCYDQAFPISLIRFWVLQVIFVSAPSLVYMGHALYRIRALEKERRRRRLRLREELGELGEADEVSLEEHRRVEKELRRLEEQRSVKKAPLRGALLTTYVIHILLRSAVEVGFIMGQYVLYGVRLVPLYKCEREPCPNSVDCYISRPTEKTVFMVFMMVISAVSLFLNVMEISHLGILKIKQMLSGQVSGDDVASSYSKVNNNKATVQQICVLRNLSPHNGPLAESIFKDYNTGLDHKVPRHNSLAAQTTGHHLSNCVTQPGQQQQQQQRPSSAIQAYSLQEAPETHSTTTYLSDPGWVGTASAREMGSGGRVQVYEDQRLQEHYQPREPPPAHRLSLALRDLGERERKDSAASSDFLFPYPRRTSFMARMHSGSMSPISEPGSPGSSDEESELGSLAKGDMVMPPPGGRRMSMASRARAQEVAPDLLI